MRRIQIVSVSILLAVLLPATASAAAPEVTINAVSSIAATSAVFSGAVDANSEDAQWWFEYRAGDTISFTFVSENGWQLSEVPVTLITGTTPQAVSQTIHGLDPDTEYEVRLVAQNNATDWSDHEEFTTDAGSPGVATGGAIGQVLAKNSGTDYDTTWTDRTTPYYAQMTLNNTGSPTHTNNGGWQKIGGGGGTATWSSSWDIRPSGGSAQVDTTNKRINVQKSGVYDVHASMAMSGISDAKLVGVGVYVNGSIALSASRTTGASETVVYPLSGQVALTAGDYVEVWAYQADSASEAYIASSTSLNRIAIKFIGPAS